MKESFLFTTRFVVERGARLFGERTALALAGDSESVVTYRELKKKSESLGWYLKERGIVKGDRVAIVGESTPNWAIRTSSYNQAVSPDPSRFCCEGDADHSRA